MVCVVIVCSYAHHQNLFGCLERGKMSMSTRQHRDSRASELHILPCSHDLHAFPELHTSMFPRLTRASRARYLDTSTPPPLHAYNAPLEFQRSISSHRYTYIEPRDLHASSSLHLQRLHSSEAPCFHAYTPVSH